jgi:beta-glucosidase
MVTLPPGADVVQAVTAPPQRTVRRCLPAAPRRSFVRHRVGTGVEFGTLDLGAVFQPNAQPAPPPDDEAIAAAAALARDVDLVVAVVGTNEEVESEGYDRTDLSLPGRQDDLVTALVAANPSTVVVVNTGAPVVLPWADEVAAVLLAWFPGQEMGNALGDVLTGAAEPGGRLPTTWPLEQSGLPATEPVDGVLSYDEGLYIGTVTTSAPVAPPVSRSATASATPPGRWATPRHRPGSPPASRSRCRSR